MKPFNLERALAGDPIVTRDGRPVTQFVQFNVNVSFPCRAVVDGNDIANYEIDGTYYPDCEPSSLDLFMAEKKSETWVNVYRHKKGYLHLSPCYPYEALALAEIIAMFDSEYVKTIKIEA